MTYLVTGGAGFIGSHIVRTLLERGERVRILDNFATGKRENLTPLLGQVEVIEGDIRYPQCQRRPRADTSSGGAALGTRSVRTDESNDVACGTVNLLTPPRRRRQARGLRRVLVGLRQHEVLPKVETMPSDPLSPYAVNKLAGELYCRAFTRVYGLEAVSLRYFNVFGPRQDPSSQYSAAIPRFIQALLADQRPTIYGDGEQSRDFTYVQNVVEASLLACHCRVAGETIHVACGERITLKPAGRDDVQAPRQPIKPNYEAPRAATCATRWPTSARPRRCSGTGPASGWKRACSAPSSGCEAMAPTEADGPARRRGGTDPCASHHHSPQCRRTHHPHRPADRWTERCAVSFHPGHRQSGDQEATCATTPPSTASAGGRPRAGARDRRRQGLDGVPEAGRADARAPAAHRAHAHHQGVVGRPPRWSPAFPFVFTRSCRMASEGYYGRLASQGYLWAERWLAGFSDRIVAISEPARRPLRQVPRRSAAALHVIPLGFPISATSSSPIGTAERSAASCPGPRERPLIGIVRPPGADQESPHVSPDGALWSSTTPRRRLQDRRRRRAARGSGAPGAGSLAPAHGSTSSAGGAISTPLYADLDVVALTSINEGTPVALIEAMAAGRAVVSTDVGEAWPTWSQTNRPGSWFQPVTRTRSRAPCCGCSADAPLRERLGREGRARAVGRYGAQRLVSDMRGLYLQLVALKRIQAARG